MVQRVRACPKLFYRGGATARMTLLLLTTHYSLLTTHYSLLTTHYSLLTTHHSLLTTHYSPLTTHYSPLTTHYSLLSAHSSRLFAYASPLYSACSLCQSGIDPCNGRGACNSSGLCSCSGGYGGVDCSESPTQQQWSMPLIIGLSTISIIGALLSSHVMKVSMQRHLLLLTVCYLLLTTYDCTAYHLLLDVGVSYYLLFATHFSLFTAHFLTSHHWPHTASTHTHYSLFTTHCSLSPHATDISLIATYC